jgi:hypothetical protein
VQYLPRPLPRVAHDVLARPGVNVHVPLAVSPRPLVEIPVAVPELDGLEFVAVDLVDDFQARNPVRRIRQEADDWQDERPVLHPL